MALKTSYENLESVPEPYRELYTLIDPDDESSGYALSGVEGVFTEKDRQELRNALDKERSLRSKLEKQMKEFGNVDLSEYKELKEKLPELQKTLDAATKDHQKAIDAAVDERVGPLEKGYKQQIEALLKDNEKHKKEAEQANSLIRKRDFDEKVVAAARQADILAEAITDTVRRASEFGWQLDENNELVPMKGDGNLKYSIKNPLEPMTFDEYLKVVLFKEAPHLYKPSTGGGAGSSSGTGHSAYKKRSEMSAAEKTNYIAQHGQEKFKQIPA